MATVAKKTTSKLKPAKVSGRKTIKAARVKTPKILGKKLHFSVMLTGVLSLVFGLWAVIWPDLTLTMLVTIFGIFIIVAGLIWAYGAISHRNTNRIWWLSLVIAVAMVAAGIYLLVKPETTITIFAVLFAIFLFIQALFDLIMASYAKKKPERIVWLVIALISVIFGVILINFPVQMSLVFVWLLGVYALVHGFITLVFAARLNRQLQ